MKLHHLFIVLFLIASCKKDKDFELPQQSSVSHAPRIKTTIAGIVKDESGNALSGVTVSVDGNSTQTNALGIYILPDVNVSKTRCVLSFIKSGLLTQYKGIYPHKNDVTYANAVMMPAEGTFTMLAAAGGTVMLSDGATATFPPDAFATESGIAYNGIVEVKMTYINPDDTDLYAKLPGGDLVAQNSAGEDKILETFGMMNIELTGSNGEKLNLANGKKSTLNFPIASSQSSAPLTIPAWYFDTEKGLWKEEGTATRNGNQYVMDVNHFTWWNCDIPYDLAYIEGYAKSCDLSPVPNANIFVNGFWGYTTNSQGFYSGPTVANYGPVPAQAYNQNNVSSQIEIIPNININQTHTMPDFLFSASNSSVLVTGILADCDNFPMQGLAVATNVNGGGINGIIYTPLSGEFMFSLVPGTYNITLSNGGLYYQQTITITQGLNCPVMDLGFLPLCQSLQNNTTNFTATLITSQYGTQTFYYTADQCTVSGNTINISATDSATGNTCSFIIGTDLYSPGNYTWDGSDNYIQFNLQVLGQSAIITPDLSSNGGNTLTSTPPVGGLVEGSFSGPVNLQIFGMNSTGYLTGNFNVYRDN